MSPMKYTLLHFAGEKMTLSVLFYFFTFATVVSTENYFPRK